MKKATKILVPVLMVLVILGSILWYLLVYDPAFTRDLILRQARNQDEKGNNASAAWLYDLAYLQSRGNEDVAIELAQQFRSIGNYTKAEYTLSNAIADNPSAKLYMELSKTYVEQDKLLDAVTMLENITDPAIKEELNALRPALPEFDPIPGFYNQHIQVSVLSSGGTLYCNDLGEYPTTASGACTEPITLGDGETVIYALCVGENGLVSPLAVAGYTVGGVVEPVTFADSAVESAIRAMLAVGSDTILYTNQLWDITSFRMPAEAKTYEDLQYLPYLQELTIENGSGNLSVLTQLTELKKLSLPGCRVSDSVLSAIGSLTSLEELDLSGCSLSTVAPLETLTNLRVLNLDSNTIRNISALSNMAALEALTMARNALVDLSALSGLSKLSILDVSYNSIPGLSQLSNCTALTELYAQSNQLTTLDGVERLSNLAVLNVSLNQITDISLLSASASLRELYVSDNQLTDITCLSTLVELTDLDFSHNAITTLPTWPKDCALRNINGSYNQLSTVEPLRDFWYLNHAYFDYNLLTTVNPLAKCPALVQVDVYGNQISDVSALTDHGIVVNYNPL